eukprot:scaffold55043_cov36-Cyclotella_meneghiniana.AAC.2
MDIVIRSQQPVDEGNGAKEHLEVAAYVAAFVNLLLSRDQISLITRRRRLCRVLSMMAFMSIRHHQTLLLPSTLPTKYLGQFVVSGE